MTDNQLPAHLAGNRRRLNEVATQGLGAAIPPHISIQGNAFTLVDGSGNKQPVMMAAGNGQQYPQPYLDVAIMDMTEVTAKRYYGAQKWTPDSNDPPTCWSANGIGPSRDAPTPQSRSCAECPHNERGSAISQVSGAAIKACRDEKWICVKPLVPGLPADMVFQFVLTPGSFKNWRAYNDKFKGTNIDIADVVCRMQFVQGVNGVLSFTGASYIDAATSALQQQLWDSKATDIYVGRNDVPIGALPVPSPSVAAASIGAPAAPMVTAPAPVAPFPPVSAATAGFTPSPAPVSLPPVAPAAQPASSLPPGPVGYPVPQLGPASAPGQAEAPRRRRRTNAEIAADQAAKAQVLTAGVPTSVTPVQAPFMAAPVVPEAAPGNGPVVAGNAPGNQFGISSGVAPNPELQGMLSQVFGAPGG